MAVQPNLDRLKSALMTSGLSQKDPPLFQVINGLIDYIRQNTLATNEMIASGGSSYVPGPATAIDELTGDVVAVGPGVVPATIQAKAVAYSKIQDTILANVLLGRAVTPGEIQELLLGSGLTIADGELALDNPYPGFTGLHNLLSETHPDTVPDSPVLGDLIRADSSAPFVAGSYVNAVIMTPTVDDFEGIRAGYMLNAGGLFPSICAAYTGIPLGTKVQELPKIWPTPDTYDAFIQASMVENFVGIRAGYERLISEGSGIYGTYFAPNIPMIAPPSPNPLLSTGIWKRLPKGNEGDALTIVDGIPIWEPRLPGIQGPIGPTGATGPTGPAGADYISAGTWTTPTYNATDFSANGAMTWTVDAGDITVYRYLEVGKTMLLTVYLRNTTIGGTLDYELRVAVPNSRTIAYGALVPMVVTTGAFGPETGVAIATAGNTYIQLFRNLFGPNWGAAGSNDTYLGFSVTFQFV